MSNPYQTPKEEGRKLKPTHKWLALCIGGLTVFCLPIVFAMIVSLPTYRALQAKYQLLFTIGAFIGLGGLVTGIIGGIRWFIQLLHGGSDD